MKIKNLNSKNIYINEIIRVTYKCNWSCKFCNVLKTNNFGEQDITDKEIVYKILKLAKKYNLEQRKNLILSFSGGEPTLNKNLCNYIKLAKKIGIGIIQLQTNGNILYNNLQYIDKLINVGLDEIFLAGHSYLEEVNKKLGCNIKNNNFINWCNYILEKKIYKKIRFQFNIVVNKINLYYIIDFLKFLLITNFFYFIDTPGFLYNKEISFALVQSNGYAWKNKEEILLKFDNNEINEIKKIIKFCEKNNIYLDLHFTAPPLCILNYPKYNLEYKKLKELEKDKKNGNINKENLESYKYLWKEKQKFDECKKCKYNDYCLGFYKNWINFVGENYAKEKVNNFLKNN